MAFRTNIEHHKGDIGNNNKIILYNMHQKDKLYIHVKKNLYSYEHIMKNKKILYVYRYID